MFDAGVVVLDTFGTPVAMVPEGSGGVFEDWSSLPLFRELVRTRRSDQILRSTRPVVSNVLRGPAQEAAPRYRRVAPQPEQP